jgi:hypothetical protein
MSGTFGLLTDPHPSHIPTDRLVESNPRVDIWALLRDGVLVEGTEVEVRWGPVGCWLATRAGGIFIDGTQLQLSWDEPMEGVGRPWFECPVCHRRCRHLYLRQLACRRCCRLDYSSRHTHRSVPGFNRLLYLRRRLGVDLKPFSPLPRRPKHHARYHRIVAEIRRLEAGLVGHLRNDVNDVLDRRICRGNGERPD